MGVRFHLALDSGAHSIYNQFIINKDFKRANASVDTSLKVAWFRNANYSYINSADYKKYVEAYVEFCHTVKDRVDYYVSLDVIFDAKLTYESHLYLESCGLKPMPVYHYGEDISWLKKYMDRTDYLGIGGTGQIGVVQKYINHADRVFRLLADKRGLPRWKTHAFGLASHGLLTRYPWYSADASSPFYLSRMGTLTAPRPLMKGDKVLGFDYMRPHQSFPVSHRRRTARHSYWTLPPLWRRVLDEYLEHLGITLEDLQEYRYRDAANLYFYKNAMLAIEHARVEKYGAPYPLKVYISGKPGGGEEGFMESLDILERLGINDFYYLGTYYLRQPFDFFLKRGMTQGKAHGKDAAKGRPRLRA